MRHGGRPARTASSCAPAWARCRATRPGTPTSAASGRRPTRCSCSPTTASSRRWATGSCRSPRRTCRCGCGSRTTTTSRRWSTTLRTLMLDDTMRMDPQIMSGTAARPPCSRARSDGTTGEHAIPEDVVADGGGAGLRPLDHALRALRRRGGRRPPLAKIKDAFESRSRARASGARSTTPRRHRRPRATRRARAGRRAVAGLEQHDRLVRRREGGHIGFSPCADDRRATRWRSATSCARDGGRRAGLHGRLIP